MVSRRICTVVTALLLLCCTPADAGEPPEGDLATLWKTGEAAFHRGALDEALTIFTTALERDMDQARTWNYLGGVHFARRHYFKALLNFKQALALDPKDVRVCNNIATAYERLGQFDRAETYYLRAIEIDPGYPVSYRNLGVLYDGDLHRPADARRYWRRFLALAPASPDADIIERAMAGKEAPAGED